MRDAARLSLALAWVEGQAAYFNKTSVRHQGKYKFLGRVALCLAVAGFFLPLVGWLVPILIGREIPYLKQIAHTLPTIALLWAALIWNYSELRGYIQEARQYDRMYEIFQAARARLRAFERESTPESFAAAESTIRKLGQDALAENGDWLSMHRERKLKAEIAAG